MLALLPEDAGLRTQDSGHLSYVDLPYHESMDEHARYIIDRAIERASGNQTKAAEFLKLQRTYLLRLIKQRKSRQA
jgi:DNA-binding NtrC family response regulator